MGILDWRCRRGCARLIALVALVVLVSGCGEDATEGNRFSLIDQEVHDTPDKAVIVQHVVASQVPTKEQLADEIYRRYLDAAAMQDFKHHDAPTKVYIYVYSNEEQAFSKKGLWLAMLETSVADQERPRILIDEQRLTTHALAWVREHGLSEAGRKIVFAEISQSEMRAMEDADERFAVRQGRPSHEALTKKIDWERSLMEQYKAEIAERYDLTSAEMSNIVAEGVKKGWPR